MNVNDLVTNVLYNEDCLLGIKKIPSQSIDCIISDMPYNITSMKWDNKIPLKSLWEEFNRIIKPTGNIVLFSSSIFTIQLINSNIENFKYRLIWKKNVPTGMSSAKYRPMKYYEEICIFNKSRGTYNPILKPRTGKGKDCYNYDHYCGKSNHVDYVKMPKKYNPDFVQPSDILEFNVVPNRNGKLHPTQKPIELIEYLIKTYTNVNDVILDPFAGSGTTLLGCLNTNRKYIGFEIDEKFFNVAENRLLMRDERR